MRSVLVTALVLAFAGEAGRAAELRGRLDLQALPKRKPAAASEMAHAVVYFQPDPPVAPRPPAEPFEIVTENKTFSPRVLAVPVGSTVGFPNHDPILHNVFSVSPTHPFDVGLYGRGEGRTETFDRPGLVRVFCNVHHSMVAYILVLDTPFSVRPDADGSFVLEGLPAGRGRLTAWHERADPVTREVEVPTAEPLAIRLDLEGRRVPPHLNKLGRPYRRSRDGRYD